MVEIRNSTFNTLSNNINGMHETKESNPSKEALKEKGFDNFSDYAQQVYMQMDMLASGHYEELGMLDGDDEVYLGDGVGVSPGTARLLGL